MFKDGTVGTQKAPPVHQSERAGVLGPPVLSHVSPLCFGSSYMGGAGPRKGAGVIRGTWGSGSGYFKTGLDVLQYLNSHHKTRWHTCQTQPRFHKREAIAQRVALMLWIKEAPFLFSTAAEVPVFCKFSSKPHKGPWKPSKAMPAAANTHKTLCN